MSSQPNFNPDTHTEILNQWGLVLCAMTYGAHISLFALSLRPILKRRNRYLLVYILLLFVLATAGFGLQAWWTQVAFIKNSNYPGGPNQFLLDNANNPANKAVTAIYLALNWLSDGIILYRFYTLCGCGFAMLNRRWALLFFVGPSSLALITLGISGFPQIAGLGINLWTDMSVALGIAYMALSLSINTTLTLLIIGRLIFLRRQLTKIIGPSHSRTYTSVVALLIESASLYTIVALMTVIACGVSSPMQYVLLPMLGQLQAIPPLLITARLATGNALDEEKYTSLHAMRIPGRTLTKKLSQVIFKSQSSTMYSEPTKHNSCLKVDTSVATDAYGPFTAGSSASSELSLPPSYDCHLDLDLERQGRWSCYTRLDLREPEATHCRVNSR